MTNWNSQAFRPNPPPYFGAATDAIFTLLQPPPNAQHVSTTPLLRMSSISGIPGLNFNTYIFSLDGNVIATSFSGTGPDVRGTGYVIGNPAVNGRIVFQCIPKEPFEPGSLHTLTASVEVFGVPQTATWTFRVAPEEGLFLGTDLAPIEQFMLSPMTRFLDIEPVRRAMLDVALEAPPPPGVDATALASRVIYQLAFGTEASSVLNPFMRPNANFMKSKVPGRRRAIDIDRRMAGSKQDYLRGVDSLVSLSALPREYQANLIDYLESMLYPYRLSAFASLVMYAKALENIPEGALQQIFEHGLGSDIPFDLGG